MTRTEKQQKLEALQAEAAALQAELDRPEQSRCVLLQEDSKGDVLYKSVTMTATPIKLPTVKELLEHYEDEVVKEIMLNPGAVNTPQVVMRNTIYLLTGIRLELE